MAPELTELETDLAEHAFTRELARSLSTSAQALVTRGAGLYIALATLGDLTSHISAAAAAAGVAVEAAASAASRRAAARRAAKRSDYYYLYRLARQAEPR